MKLEVWLPPWNNPRNPKTFKERSHDETKHASEEKSKRGIGRKYVKYAVNSKHWYNIKNSIEMKPESNAYDTKEQELEKSH